MALKCGIIGLPNIGKTTLFNCISNTKAETTSFAYTTNKSNMGVASVPDTCDSLGVLVAAAIDALEQAKQRRTSVVVFPSATMR